MGNDDLSPRAKALRWPLAAHPALAMRRAHLVVDERPERFEGPAGAFAVKLIEQARTRWRSVNAPELVALVRAGVKFEKGVMVERTDGQNEEVAASSVRN